MHVIHRDFTSKPTVSVLAIQSARCYYTYAGVKPSIKEEHMGDIIGAVVVFYSPLPKR